MTDTALNLVVLRSPKPERTALFYGLLGIPFERERHGGGPEHFAGRAGPVVLEIYPLGSGSDGDAVRLGFSVASIAACTSRFLSFGFPVATPGAKRSATARAAASSARSELS